MLIGVVPFDVIVTTTVTVSPRTIAIFCSAGVVAISVKHHRNGRSTGGDHLEGNGAAIPGALEYGLIVDAVAVVALHGGGGDIAGAVGKGKVDRLVVCGDGKGDLRTDTGKGDGIDLTVDHRNGLCVRS